MKNKLTFIALFILICMILQPPAPVISKTAVHASRTASGSSWDTKIAATADGNYTYSGTGTSVIILVKAEGRLKKQGTLLYMPSPVSDLKVQGSVLYVAAGHAGFYLFDIREPQYPVYIGTYTPRGYINAIEIRESVAFLAEGNNSLEILDISNPADIRALGKIRSAGIPKRIRTDEGYLYVLDSCGSLHTFLLPAVPAVDEGSIPGEGRAKGGKTAYITIDDGPSRNNTPRNLDTLKKYGIKATFFVLPRKNMDDIYKRILEEGHAIGNHSYCHDYHELYGGTIDGFREDLLKARTFIYEKLHYTTVVFRFPGGSMGRRKELITEREEVLSQNGYRFFDWNVSTADTDSNLKKYGSEEDIANLLANNVIKNTRGRKKLIILMHDAPDKIYSVKALPKIIEGLKDQGYSFDVLTNYGK